MLVYRDDDLRQDMTATDIAAAVTMVDAASAGGHERARS